MDLKYKFDVGELDSCA